MNFETWWKTVTDYRKAEALSSETWLKKLTEEAYKQGRCDTEAKYDSSENHTS